MLIEEFKEDIHFLRDPTRGGVATVLNEIAGKTKMGIELQESLLPVEEQVAAACEILGLDPVYVANEGVFITIVDRSVMNSVLDILKSMEETQNAAMIGTVTSTNPGKVIIQSEIGGKRVVNMLTGSQLPRIC